MTSIDVYLPRTGPTMEVSDAPVEDIYPLLQEDPLHIDLSPYPTALTSRDNVDCLIAHIRQFAVVESLNLEGMEADASVLDSLINSTEVVGVTRLTYLNLRRTNLTPLQLERLLVILKARAPYLKTLDISENALGDIALEMLIAWDTSRLQALRIAGNSLSAAAVTKLLMFLVKARPTGLERLELSDNHFDYRASEALKVLLTTTECRTTLKELRVSHCGLNEANSTSLAEGLLHSAVELLDIANNDCLLSFLLPVDAQHTVSFPSKLRALCLSGNVCKRAAVRPLVASLQGCSTQLEELYLSKTLQNDAALSVLLTGLNSMLALRVLDLSHCGLTYRSGKVLAQQLPMHPKLTTICLSHNMLEAEGAMDLSSGIERLGRLLTLDFAACHLGNCGAVAVVTSLLRSTAPVAQLDISENAINDAGMREVCTLLSRITCPQLQQLTISRNDCTKETRSSLLNMMEGRQSACQVVADDTPLEELANTVSSVVASRATSLPSIK